MDRCPACRARYKGNPTCYRCGTDLTLPLEAERQAGARAQQALQDVLEDDIEAARVAIDQAIQLKAEPAFLALQAFITDHQKLSPIQLLKQSAGQFFTPHSRRDRAAEQSAAVRLLEVSKKRLHDAVSKLLGSG